ncbi:hypothetical protein [Halobacterium sp. CBA1126]|uniref:hypothetical protein n=1 Tax=Halobacterium sp. CBA1126 TaxID=2668074 RepID=UPI0012FAD602|nr:hypothetical protein [Halobacterium sp. CBA1126]MUV61726.1 hypothetical protein [Halobacterium sp. CBA1126]
MTSPGLTLTRQTPAAPATTLVLDEDTTPTQVARTITTTPGLQDALVATVHDAAAGETALAFRDTLLDAGITHHQEFLADAVVSAVREYPRAELKQGAVQSLLRTLHGLASGRHDAEDALAVPRLLALNDEPAPTVTVRLEDEFLSNVRRSQRDPICRYLAELAQGVDVRIVASGRVQLKLYHEHRDDLPVSRSDIAPLAQPPTTEDVETAATSLDPDGRPVQILRQLAEEPAETLSYHELYASYEVSESRVRQCISTLSECGLVATHQAGDQTHVDLLNAGTRVLEALDADVGQQATLEETVTGGVSETGNSVSDSRVTPPAREGRPRGRRLADHHETTYLQRWEHAAAAATAPDGGVGLLDYPVEPRDDRGGRGWSYDHDRDRLVVSAEYDNPLQYWVCTALALADHRTWTQALTPDVLEDTDPGGIILRQARCVGGVTAEAEDDSGVLVERLQEWASDLAELTRRLSHGEYDDENRFRGEILRSALGLAGSIVHLLDVAGITVTREVRLPRFRQFDDSDRGDLARTLSIGAAIQSRYGHFAAYRQLLESREDKQRAALHPDVDAEGPYGSLIGGFTLVGPGVESFQEDLEDALQRPGEVVEDAPEFQVPVTVQSGSTRSGVATAAQHVLAGKDLSLTRTAVSVLDALTGTPYDAAKALHQLAGESKAPGRRVNTADLRYALSQLDADRILPSGAPTVSKAIHALLATDEPLDQAALAEAADVSTRSLRTHRDILAALPWTTVDGTTYELSLSPDSDDGVSAVFDVALEVATEDVVDAETELGAAFVWPPGIERLRREWWWADAVLAWSGGVDEPGEQVAFGPRLEQAPLAAAPKQRGGEV